MTGLWNRLKRSGQHHTRDSLSAYLDGEVLGEEAARIERHLKQCDDCRLELDSLKQTAQLLERLPRLAVPRSFLLPASAAASKRTFKARSRVYHSLQGATVLAALLVAFILVGDVAFLARNGVSRRIQTAATPLPKVVIVEKEAEVVLESPAHTAERLSVEEEPAAESALRPGAPQKAKPAEMTQGEAERSVERASEELESKRAVVAGTAASASEARSEAANGDQTGAVPEAQEQDLASEEPTAAPGAEAEALAEREPTPIPTTVPDKPQTTRQASRLAAIRWAEIIGGLALVVLLISTLLVRRSMRRI